MSIQYKDLSNAVRFLSIDAVEKANSGHLGLPMGMADVATVLFKHFLKFNTKDIITPTDRHEAERIDIFLKGTCNFHCIAG